MKVNKIGLISVEGIRNCPNELLLKASDGNGRTYRYYMDTTRFKDIKQFCKLNNINMDEYVRE